MNRAYFTKAGSCLTAAFGFFMSPTVQAQSDIDDPRDRENEDVVTIAPSSEWSVVRRSDRCRLARTFGSGEDQVSLRLEKGGVDATFNLTLFGNPVRNPYGNIISLRFGPGQHAFGRTYISATSSKGRPAIVLYGTSYAAAIEKGEGGHSALEPTNSDFSQMTYLEIGRAGLKPFKLNFDGSLADVSAELDECTRELETDLLLAAFGQATRAKPSNDPGQWILSKDYPPMMLRYNMDGTLQYRLTVNRNGKPTFCSISSSTLPQMFDNAACVALLKNAKFTPALDMEGNPIESYWRSAVRFQIQR